MVVREKNGPMLPSNERLLMLQDWNHDLTPFDMDFSRQMVRIRIDLALLSFASLHIVQELCESRGGRPGLSVLASLLVSVDVKIY